MDVIVVLLSAASLAAWIYLIGFRGSFWRADLRLESSLPPPPWTGAVAIVPARNEEKTIEAALAGLLAQDYPGPLSILLIDDDSTDRTLEIARNLAATPEAKGRIEVLSSPPLAAGWSGKLWAVHHGIEHAAENMPDAEYLFLTDADTVHGRETVKSLIAKARADGRDLVSLMVRLNCQHLWERLLIPAFVFFFQMLYPFNLVNDDDDTTAAAAGACILIRKDALERAGGIAAIRSELIDDCALAHIVKRSGGKIWLGLAEDSESLRVYETLSKIWDMVARTAYTQLQHSPHLLGACVAGMAVVFLLPALVILALPVWGNFAALALALPACALMAICYAPTLAYYRQSGASAVLLPLAALLFIAMTLGSATRHRRGKGAEWKARSYGGDPRS